MLICMKSQQSFWKNIFKINFSSDMSLSLKNAIFLLHITIFKQWLGVSTFLWLLTSRFEYSKDKWFVFFLITSLKYQPSGILKCTTLEINTNLGETSITPFLAYFGPLIMALWKIGRSEFSQVYLCYVIIPPDH